MPRVFNRKSIKDRRRELRNNMPDAEVLMWTHGATDSINRSGSQ
jgi:hypothetical protein